MSRQSNFVLALAKKVNHLRKFRWISNILAGRILLPLVLRFERRQRGFQKRWHSPFKVRGNVRGSSKSAGGWDSNPPKLTCVHVRTQDHCHWASFPRLTIRITLLSYCMSYTKLMWSALPNDAPFNFPCRIKGPDDVTGHPVWFPVPSFRWVLYASLGIMCLSGGPPWWLDYRLDFILLGTAPSL